MDRFRLIDEVSLATQISPSKKIIQKSYPEIVLSKLRFLFYLTLLNE